MHHATRPLALHFSARDGYPLHGHVWAHAAPLATRPVVIVNPATAVLSRYYARFAAFLHAAGCDVLTYDYRGIGGSRPPSLRGFRAGWIEWGSLDFEGALCEVQQRFPGQPVHVAAHSAGGLALGLAPSNHVVTRVFTMGAQFAHWRDYARDQRLGMWWKWHVLMPALTACLGYFPGRRLGWMEDAPAGVVADWTARAPRFEAMTRRHGQPVTTRMRAQWLTHCAQPRADLLALSISDDPFAGDAAIERLLAYFTGCRRWRLHVRPQQIGVAAIGHFAFFHDRFADTLWPIARDWLLQGECPSGFAPTPWPDEPVAPSAMSRPASPAPAGSAPPG